MLTVPSVISTYERHRRSNPRFPWQRIQSRKIAARKRLFSASLVFPRDRGRWPWMAVERYALHSPVPDSHFYVGNDAKK